MKFKRIMALIGALLLLAMYISTFIFALTDHSASKGLLKASIACTIILPVLLYAYTLVYNITRNASSNHIEETADSENTEDEDMENTENPADSN